MEPFALINEDGSCPDEYLDLIPNKDLAYLVELILFNRVFDKRMVLLQRQGRIGFYLTSTGEESTIVGASYCLESKDPIFLSYRELGAVLVRGVPRQDIMNQLYGNAYDLAKGRQMPIHFSFKEYEIPSVSSPVETQLPHACGYAYAAKMRNTGQVAMAFTGEGSTSEGDFHTALNFSGEFRVPAVYVIRNNGYAISTPESVQTAAESFADRGVGYGVPGVRVDGNDLLAVVKVVREAVDRARNGDGPTLIEALTYRLGAHSTSDDPSGYRTKEEEEAWAEVDHIKRLLAHAKWRGVWDDEKTKAVQEKSETEISELIKVAEQAPLPELESMFEDVYCDVPLHLQKQKSAHLQFLKSLKQGGDV